MKLQIFKKADELFEELGYKKESENQYGFVYKKLTNRIPLKFADDKFCERYDNSLMCVEELVERATQSRVRVVDSIGEGVNYIPIWGCPCCNEQLDEDEKHNYCPTCGKALDWSE